MKTAIILPAYNEEKNIRRVIEKIPKDYQVIVVDDGSLDNTHNVCKNEGVIVLRHQVNLGKGAALLTGCEYALNKGAQNIITMDADGQHDPKDVETFILNLKQSDGLIVGKRIASQNTPFVRLLGKKFTSLIFALLFKQIIYDPLNGFRAFTSRTYKKIKWQSSDYSVELEMLIRAIKENVPIKQIVIKTIYHDAYKGPTLSDAYGLIINMLKWRVLL